jgi:hypothetical protein
MVSSRVIVAAAMAITMIAASPALADSSPKAKAAGGAPVAPPTFPSLVNERLVRVQAALDRATESADEHQPNAAAATLMSARANLRKAWTSAQYIIQTTPPPVVVPDDLKAQFHPKLFTRSGRLKLAPTTKSSRLRAHKSGAPVAAGAVASIYDTAFAVLSLQHRMATISTGLIDTAHSTLLSSLSTSLFTALNGRDQAVAYIHSIDIAPPPPVDDIVAHAADDPVPEGWAVVMPNLVPYLDDEIQQINGTVATTTPLRVGTGNVLAKALAQNTATEAQVNLFWPPAPPVDD